MGVIRSFFIAAACVIATQPALAQQPANTTPQTVQATTIGEIRIEKIATVEYPWGMAYLPDGRLLITEKPGRLRILANNQLSEPIQGLPQVTYRGPRDQGGLMDVEVDPKFQENSYIYLSYVEAAEEQPRENQATDDFRLPGVDLSDNVLRGGVVARAKLADNRLTEVKVIWRQTPKTVGRGHFGNRIVFGQDGKMFITSADRMRFDPAQSLASNLGKVVRINTDGSIPDDNPFASREGALKDIWAYGVRNALCAAVDPSNGNLWIVEMGPAGGDELNLVKKGANYGWPLAAEGSHYTRQGLSTAYSMIPGHRNSKDFEGPVRAFSPVISPSGATFYTGEAFKGWRGSLFVGGLSSRALIRLQLNGENVAVEERIDMKRRIRDVAEAKDGSIIVAVDDKQGDILKLLPAK